MRCEAAFGLPPEKWSSGLIAIKVADNPRILCAAPGHIQANGVPRTLAKLDDHVCLTLHAMDAWVFSQAGERVAKRVAGRLSASSVDALRAACRAGAGFALLTYWDVAQDLTDGSLVAVPLDDAETEPLAIWAVLPTRRHVPARVRRFIDEMKASLSKLSA